MKLEDIIAARTEEIVGPVPERRRSGISDARAKEIILKMADPGSKGRHQVLTLTRKVLHFDGISQFLREGVLADVEHVERLLGIR